MACVNVSSSASISVMELIMTTVLPELSVAPAVNDDPGAPGGFSCSPQEKIYP